MESKITYDVFHLVYWDWRIAMDLFLGGMGIGAMLYALFISYYRKEKGSLLVKIGSVIAPLAVGTGILFMFTELGHPFRIWRTFTNFNPTSTLSWGGILQQVFIVISAMYAYLALTQKNEALRYKLGMVAALFAVSVGLYHGFLLSFVTARPLWSAGATSIISFISSIITGIAAVLLCASFTNKGRKEIKELSGVTSNILALSILLQISAVAIWMVSLATGKADFVDAFNTLNREFGLQFWGGAILVGLVIPFVLIISRKDKLMPVFFSNILILAGGFLFRCVLIICGQMS